MKKFEEYYIGLDMGTGSVGWAVTDSAYNIIKRHGKALWGIRLFESAKTAEERRIFRTSRRRTERRKNRLHLLQEIFAEEISKKDMGFYQRMKESKYWHEDKKDINGNMPELPYALFADDGFTDKDYYKKYPTIFHLRYALATNTTDAIDLDELFTNRYDIDHIYPQSKVMDDSIDNRVLVKRDLNSKKTDTFPVSEEYRKAGKALWSTLLKKGLISKEKYKRLTRTEPFGEDELAGFIARQLVETRQSTKAVAHLLEEAYPDAEIVYAKARAVSEFRHKFDMIKVREVNDFHHAKDAYLNIVVGNTYYVKFTKDAAWFVRNNPGRTYNLKKMFENETVKRGNETAWIPGDNGTICTVKKWMRKNNVLFTRRAYEVKGGLFDQNILKKGKGQIPIKGGADERLQSIEKYGAYNKASGAYFMLVESDGKKGERKRTIEFVPVYLAKSLEESVELRRRYCEEELGLVNPDVRILKIKINTLFDVDGFKMHLSGRTGKQLLFKGANQLVLSEELQLIVKKIGKYCADYKENKEAVLSEKSEVTQEVLEELYDEFLHKLRNSLYGHRLSAQIEKIEKGKEIFQSMSNEQKCLILMEILHLFQCASQAANLQLIDGPGKAGILVLNNDISKLEDIKIINQWHGFVRGAIRGQIRRLL